MSKYSDMSYRARNIADTLRVIKSNPNRWLVDAAYSTNDKSMEYYAKLGAECDRYLAAVTAILEEQLKVDQAKIDAVEELLRE